MSKRPSEASHSGQRKKRQTLTRGQVKNYKAHLGVPSRRAIDGPGIWAMTVKGKEKQAVSELHGIVESISDQLWPRPVSTETKVEDDSEDSEGEEDIEKQLAKELLDMNKKKPKSSEGRRIASCQTDTACVIYLATKKPIDPVKVTLHYMEQVAQTGVSGVRSLVRLLPASGQCAANMAAMTSLAAELFAPVFAGDAVEAKRYKIELKIRNHQVLAKEEVIKAIAQCVPSNKGHTVSLTSQDTTIIVEIFKAICTIAVVPDYEKYKRFNVVQIVQAHHKVKGEQEAEGSRVVSQVAPAG